MYAWLARSYAKDIGDTDPKKWQRYVRRAEALYALVAQHKGGENGVAGVEWATKALSNGGTSEIDFSAAAEPGSPNYYLKQPWGAYGAAYASQLFEIGIFAQASGHDIPVPSKGLGDRLADTFDAGLPASKPFLAAVGEGKVSLSQLKPFADITPSSIAPNGEEHACYEDILFANAGLAREEDIDRKRSLLLLLGLTRHLGSVPGVFDVRWLLYGGLDSQSRQLVFDSDELQLNDGAGGFITRTTCFIFVTRRFSNFALMCSKIIGAGSPYPGSWEKLAAGCYRPVMTRRRIGSHS